jgi:hypothetical protein
LIAAPHVVHAGRHVADPPAACAESRDQEQTMTITAAPVDRAFRRKQGLVVGLSLAAALVVAAVGSHATAWFAGCVPAGDDLATRLAFAVRWLVAPGAMLLLGIQVAASRGFHPDAIDGTRTPASRYLEIALRYNQNTLEQAALAAIAWLGLAVTVPHAHLAFIPAMALLFVAGRATFWIGYLLFPTMRAFGMVLTGLPTIVAIVWLILRAFASG